MIKIALQSESTFILRIATAKCVHGYMLVITLLHRSISAFTAHDERRSVNGQK